MGEKIYRLLKQGFKTKETQWLLYQEQGQGQGQGL
jgi:hypothetical protein